MKTNNNNEANASDTHAEQGRRNAPTVMVDYQKYATLLEDTDLTEGEKREFIDAIWGIIVDFVSLGFDVHPVQQVEPEVGQQTKCKDASRAGDEIQKDLPLHLVDMISLGQPKQQEDGKAKRGSTRRLEREES